MKKLLAITGIRSEYDILFPILDSLRNDPEFEVKLVISGAHLSEIHGNTLKIIETDGFNIADKIDTFFSTNRKIQRAKGVGLLTAGLAQCVERENPDFLFVVGDREESIATAIVGNYMDVLTAHLGGGDPVFGNADDPMRFAVSKLAHIHFTTAEEYSKNLLKIGEESFRIFWTGNPSFDNIRKVPQMPLVEISNYLDFKILPQKYIVLIKHPLSSEKEEAYQQMAVSLDALETFCQTNQFKVIGIYPNTDPGAFEMIKSIEEHSNSQNIKFFKTLPRNIFINLIRNSSCICGNSSMGILESPFYKLPVVNIGNRQQGRLNAGNVNFVQHDKNSIIEGLNLAIFNEEYRHKIKSLPNPFGDGYSADKIKDILKEIDVQNKNWYIKQKLC
jgi:GDP/UDP-N,N'-diacetylbacillosamine 2-epimerase (hydrolysing)